MRRAHSSGSFLVAMAWRMGLYIALTIGFPFILVSLAQWSDCSSVGGACGAVMLVGSFYLRPIIVIGFLLLMIWPVLSRMRAYGVPGWFGLVVPLLFAADWQFLTMLGSHWSYGFALGVLGMPMPLFSLLALVVTVAMISVREPSGETDTLWNRHGMIGRVALASVIVVAALGVLLQILLQLATASAASLNGLGTYIFAFNAHRFVSMLAVVSTIGTIIYIVLDAIRGGAAGTPLPPPPSSSRPPSTPRMVPGGGASFGRRST